MNRRNAFALALVAAFALVGLAADAPKDTRTKTGEGTLKLPPGWTVEDMQACVVAGTPGKMHEFMARGVGTWRGKNTMWMGPGAEPVRCESTATVTSVMGGRYLKAEMSSDVPGMGPYSGLGIYGFDNVLGKFVATWIDSQSTGIMTGTGELSDDGKTLTWTYTYQCPLTKKPATVRSLETYTSPTTWTMEMFGVDPKSGKEFQMTRIEFTKVKA